jgi:hypothetical protein
MELGLALKVLELALSVWKDERRDHFTKKVADLRAEHRAEMAKEEYDDTNPEHHKGDQSRFRSELALGDIMFQCDNIAQLVVGEASQH